MLLASGCAIFSDGEKSAAYAPAPQPATASAAKARRAPAAAPFEAAYGVGRPVALIPCSRGAVLTDDCRATNDRHQVSGERVVKGEETVFIEASTTVIPK